mgnify:CR=1 FL=1
MKYKNILFDFGDTLVYLQPSKEDVFLKVLSENGIKIDKEEIKKAFLHNDYIKQSAITLKNEEGKRNFLINYNKKILSSLNINDNLDSLAIKINNEFKKTHWKLFSDTIPVLEKLKKMRFRLALLSNWESKLHEVCKKLGIYDYFELVLASTDVGIEKPNREFFEIILSKLDMVSKETIYIGNDYELDVISSRNVGIKPILIDRDNIYEDKDCDRIKTLDNIFPMLK